MQSILTCTSQTIASSALRANTASFFNKGNGGGSSHHRVHGVRSDTGGPSSSRTYIVPPSSERNDNATKYVGANPPPPPLPQKPKEFSIEGTSYMGPLPTDLNPDLNPGGSYLPKSSFAPYSPPQSAHISTHCTSNKMPVIMFATGPTNNSPPVNILQWPGSHLLPLKEKNRVYNASTDYTPHRRHSPPPWNPMSTLQPFNDPSAQGMSTLWPPSDCLLTEHT